MTATKATVLVVEDDPSTIDLMRRLLSRHDFDVQAASSAGEALVLLEQEELPAAVILDLRLPDASGGLVLRRIRRAGLPIRVAILTGATNPEMFADLLEFPPDAIFRKPVNQSELVRWLTRS